MDFLPAKVDIERRIDGTIVLRSPEPLSSYPRCLGEYLERWAELKPEATFLAQRLGDGWRMLNWAEARRKVRAIASSLLSRKLSPERPVVILSDNSIEHALLALAAMHAGIPVAPISPAYCLMSKDFIKLGRVFELLDPGLVYAEDGRRFAPALQAIGDREFELVVLRNPEGLPRPAQLFDILLGDEDAHAVDRAFAAIGPDTIAKFLLTSGSTGEPKGVINTHRMLCSNQESLAQCWRFLYQEPPVLVDWLPWNHTFGGNNNFDLVLSRGGTLYIDEGKPAPGLIETTVRNLREASPTIYYNVPRGYDILLPYLESDPALRRSFFARLKIIMYAAAALPATLWERLEKLSMAELGRRVSMTSAWGATETAPMVTLVHYQPLRSSVIGLPTPGCELKLLPVAETGKYELRVRGPNVTPGYWKRADLTNQAFDEESFYRIGDAGRFADPADPAQGIEFAGRIAEDFKLTSGTWVHVGALRVKALTFLSPIAQDLVITGHDRDEAGFLIFPNIAGCRSLCPELDENTPLKNLLADSRIIDHVRERLLSLAAEGGGSSSCAGRAIFLEEPPSIDAGEITDKGYINQRAVLERRAAMVESLYAEPAPQEVMCINSI
jgi:feruloyl-CoA synthase